jgi:hypothetical protein
LLIFVDKVGIIGTKVNDVDVSRDILDEFMEEEEGRGVMLGEVVDMNFGILEMVGEHEKSEIFLVDGEDGDFDLGGLEKKGIFGFDKFGGVFTVFGVCVDLD